MCIKNWIVSSGRKTVNRITHNRRRRIYTYILYVLGRLYVRIILLSGDYISAEGVQVLWPDHYFKTHYFLGPNAAVCSRSACPKSINFITCTNCFPNLHAPSQPNNTCSYFRLQQAASLEKVLKEQQQQQLDLERTWEQDREAKGNGNSSPASDQRLQEHSPPPASEKSIPSTPVSQAQVAGPQLMTSPVPGLHHMQQLLQQHVLSPTQLQSLMKQHSLLQQQQQQQVRGDVTPHNPRFPKTCF